MIFKPYPYQEISLEWLRERDKAALFLSPGMGKSVVTATIMSERILEGRNKGFLIVAPIRVVNCTWPEQIAFWEHTKWMKVANLRTPEGVQAW